MSRKKRVLTSEEASNRLRAIHQRIHGSATAQLDWREWRDIKRYLTEFDFPCTLEKTTDGFVFIVYKHEDMQIRPEYLLKVEDDQFGFRAASGKGQADQRETLERLKPFLYRARNLELIAWYKLSPLPPARSLHTYAL